MYMHLTAALNKHNLVNTCGHFAQFVAFNQPFGHRLLIMSENQPNETAYRLIGLPLFFHALISVTTKPQSRRNPFQRTNRLYHYLKHPSPKI